MMGKRNSTFQNLFRLKLIVFLQAILFSFQAQACDAPSNRFCVEFFNGTNLEGESHVVKKTPGIKYIWADGSPARGIQNDNFSARWRGQFRFDEGEYAFLIDADDGVRIKLDGKVIIDHWNTSVSKHHESVPIVAGMHLLEVEYFEATGKAYITVDWKQLTQQVNTKSPNKNRRLSRRNKLKPNATSSTQQEINPVSTKTLTKRNNKNTDVSNQNPLIGTNLSPFSYWSSSVPFKDLMMQSGVIGVFKKSSNERCSKQPPLDKEGYPVFLPKGCVFRVWSAFHIMNEYWPTDTFPYQSGRYVLLHQGRGKIRLGWDARKARSISDGRIEFDVPTPGSGIQIEVTAIDVNDPIRDMHIVHIDDEDTYQTQPFNEKWLELLKPFKVIRFMDWGAVGGNISVYRSKAISHTSHSIKLSGSAPAEDGVFDNMVALINVDDKWPRIFIDKYDGATRTLHLKSPIKTSTTEKQPTVDIFDFVNRDWSKRTNPTTLGQGSNSGVAFEYMIKLANTLNVDPWITIPTAANDSFVEELALLIKDTLNPDLKCYIEYSNETWNYSYPGYHYSEAKVRQLGLTGAVVQADAWHPYRAIEIFKIFNQVFKEPDLTEEREQSRLIRVLTSQTAWLERAKAIMDWQMPGMEEPTNGNPAHKFADVWASTVYFGIKDKNQLEHASLDELMKMQIESINTLFGDTKNPGVIRKILEETKARNLQLVVYEGGTHLLAPQDKPKLVAKLVKVNQDHGMKEVYTHLVEHWSQLYQEFGADNIGAFNHFNDVNRYSKYGYWGLLQSTYQNPETAPKYQVIRDWKLK